MEVILLENVDNLGYKDELVTVKPGYGRNFLIPKKLAKVATVSEKKVLKETVKQRAFKEQKLKTAAEETAANWKDLTIKVGAKAGDTGKIFGSVTSVQLADAIAKLGHTVERKDINFGEEAVKTLGTYTATIRLHKDVTCEVTYDVVAE